MNKFLPAVSAVLLILATTALLFPQNTSSQYQVDGLHGEFILLSMALVPQDISVTERKGTSITITWSMEVGESEIEEYIVEIKEPEGEFVEAGTTAETFFTQTDLIPSTAYTFRVQAKDTTGYVSDWSEEINISTISYGSVNYSDDITVSDALIILRGVVGLVSLTEDQEVIADVSGDGKVDVSDAVLILRFIVRLIQEFPVVEKSVLYKVYGLNFGPYTKEGQDPNHGTAVSAEQITELLTIIAPYTKWVRTFGCTSGLENVGRVAHELHLQAAVGAWLGRDMHANAVQIASLIIIAQEGHADLLVVGSEVLLRGNLTEAQLIEYINEVKNALPGIQVTYADVYSVLLEHPAVIAAVDLIFVNYYPYWEGIDIEKAISNLNYWHQSIVTIAGGKTVIVSETGWPSEGNTIGSAVPSPENASFYFLNFVSWAKEKDVSYFYFEAFDEPWKADYEGTQGAHWGIWDKNGNLKEGMQDVFDNKTIPENWDAGDIPGGPGDPSIEFTYVPPYGSTDYLLGQAWHVKPSEYNVAVYIKVGSGWWTKPYLNSPLTLIGLDGSWTCNIVTGGVDQEATQIAAYLLPAEYDPPLMTGGSTLPDTLEMNSVAKVTVTRTP